MAYLPDSDPVYRSPDKDLDRLLAAVIAVADFGRPAWHRLAACRSEGPELFFPERGQSVDAARSLCAGCTVTAQCFAAGLGEHRGIWAGQSERARRAIRRSNRHDAA